MQPTPQPPHDDLFGSNTSPSIEVELNVKQHRLMWSIVLRFMRRKLAVLGLLTTFVLIVLAILTPFITRDNPSGNPYSYFAWTLNTGTQDSPPVLSWPIDIWNLLGNDNQGHQLSVELLWGSRPALAIAFGSALGCALIGVIVGGIAGYFRGIIDTVMMRITDVFLSLPFLPILLAIATYIRTLKLDIGIHSMVLILIFVVFNWSIIARLTRASFLALGSQEYIEAARATGLSNMRIIFRHILPNALRPIIVQTTLSVAGFMITEATIDFLGAGIQYPPDITWGNILAGAQTGFGGNWWWPTFPGLIITITVLAINFVGDGLADSFDVRSKG